MRLKKWLDDNSFPVGMTILIVFAVVVFILGFRNSREERLKVEAITKEDAVFLSRPIWLDKQRSWSGDGATVYLIEVKGRKLAVVIAARGAGICELTREPEAEVKP